MKKYSVSVFCSIGLLWLASCNKPVLKINDTFIVSPDSSIRFDIRINSNSKKIEYSILRNYPSLDTVIRYSELGLITSEGNFYADMTLDSVSKVRLLEEQYMMVSGKRKENMYACNEVSYHFSNAEKKKMSIRVRLFNEGVTFRYELGNSDSVKIFSELTSFAIYGSGKAWLQPFGLPSEWGPAYEEFYLNGIEISAPAPDSSGYSIPALFHTNSGFILLADANLCPNYHGVRLAQSCDNGVYTLRGPIPGDGLGTGSVVPISGPGFVSPWRVIMVGQDLALLVESNLVHHVSDAHMMDDLSWIKPGSASWSWWGEHDSPKDFKRLKAYVDLAAEMSWPYCLVDANWDLMENGGNVEKLIQYAATKNIGISLWYNSGGPHNSVSERPRDIMFYPETRKAEFEKLANWGVKAVKIDFFQSDKQNVIQLYHDILKDAAQYKIMVVFHGCTTPRGLSRTYPHAVSFEAVRGAEQYGWSNEYAVKAAMHNTILPFTRNMVGPMDYTPVTFSDYECCKHQTTNAHELALAVVFESGMIHWADREWSYKKASPLVKEVMKSIPASWDETKFVSGYPGESFIIARKKDENWFVAGINGDSTAKVSKLDLAFLDPRVYELYVYQDGENERSIETQKLLWNPGEAFTANMLPKGGFLLWFKPKN